MLKFPSVQQGDKLEHESKSHGSASNDNLLPKKEATSTSSNKVQYFTKYARKMVLLKVETTHLFQKNKIKNYTVEYNQATRQEICLDVSLIIQVRMNNIHSLG